MVVRIDFKFIIRLKKQLFLDKFCENNGNLLKEFNCEKCKLKFRIGVSFIKVNAFFKKNWVIACWIPNLNIINIPFDYI